MDSLGPEGLIGRESFNEIPPRVEYTLTRDGVDLKEALMPLLKWAQEKDTPEQDNS